MPAAVHISLNVSDLSKSVEFYRGFFGEPRKLEADYAKFVTSDPEIHLALQPAREAGSASRGALSHLGIRVDRTAQVREWRDVLRGRGIVSEEEVREDCCYAVQDKFWLSDPDGNRWEIYAVIEETERLPGRTAACCAASASGS